MEQICSFFKNCYLIIKQVLELTRNMASIRGAGGRCVSGGGCGSSGSLGGWPSVELAGLFWWSSSHLNMIDYLYNSSIIIKSYII